MTNEARPLILASGSPRRRELLGRMGYEFQICSPDVDEHVSGHARDIVRTLAVRKARAAAERFDRGVIIASDTLVSLDGAPLGKPADADDARRMLRALSGREHEVFTGVCVIDAQMGMEEAQVDRTGAFRAARANSSSRWTAPTKTSWASRCGSWAKCSGASGSDLSKIPTSSSGGLITWVFFPPAAWASTWAPPT